METKQTEEKMNLETGFAGLEEKGYDFAVAIATEEEVANGAACGQLAMITELI
jgi:hypothetical protein